jgi:TRAP-type C4-dicarboxylate transport system substrate-binding protein
MTDRDNPRFRIRLIAAAFGAIALTAAGTAAAQIEIKFGHVGEPGSLFAASAEEFAKRANAKLGDKAKVVVYGSSQLGGDKELLQKLKLGTVDMALPSTVMSSEADLFGVFENPFTQIYSAKFQEVQKYLSLTGHVYTPAYVTVGAKKWASLPADVRKILEDTARETQAFVYEKAAKDDEELLGKIKAAGVAVNAPNKDAFVAASRPVYDEFAKEVAGSKEVIDRAIALGK